MKSRFGIDSLIAITCVFFVLFFTYVFVQFTVDDSLISFRYGKNLVDHGVWNWNPVGYDLVEAYTNPLHTFINIIPVYFQINPVYFFKGLHFVVFVLFSIRLWSVFKSRVVLLYLATFPGLYVHIYSGLETFIFVYFVVEGYCAAVINRRYGLWFFVICLLMPFVRPEGVLFSIIFIFCSICSEGPKKLSVFLFSVVFIWVLYAVSRYVYFGFLLPNTFYVKSDSPFNLQQFFLNLKGFFPYLFLSAVLITIIKNTQYRILSVVSLLISAFYLTSDLQMNFADRFAFQALFPTHILGLGYAVQQYKPLKKVPMLVGGAFVLTTVCSLFASYSVVREQYSGTLSVLHDLGDKLKPYSSGNVLLIGDAGILPYKSDWYAIDFVGLANSHKAHNKKFSSDYLNDRSPTMVFLYSEDCEGGENKINAFGQQELLLYMREADSLYKKISCIKWSENYYYAVYLKSGIKNYDELKDIVLYSSNESNKQSLPINPVDHFKKVFLFEYFDDERKFH